MIRKLAATVLLLALLGYAGACGYMYVEQRHLLYVPATGQDTKALTDIGFTAITYEAGDGQKLTAWWQAGNPDKPVILFLHGNTGLHLDNPGKYKDLAARGYGLLLAGYRGFDGNDGQPTEDGLNLDATAALTMLIKGLNIPQDHIVVYGESLGTGIATRLTADFDHDNDDNLRALILDGPYTSMTALGETRYPWLPVSYLLLDRYDSLSRIRNIDLPLLVINGSDDAVIPPAMGKELFDAARPPKSFVQIPGGHHADLYDFGAGQIVQNFLDGLQ